MRRMAGWLEPRAPGSIRADALARRFGPREVLKDLSFTASAGSVVAVVGANGSGKTTLLRILAGVLDPSSGEASVAGEPTGRGNAGFVPAGERMLNWRLSARQNLEFLGGLAGIGSAELAGRIAAVAGALDATDLLEEPIGSCSTGQRRRVMVAAGLLAGPPVALLDEPFADLDDAGARTVGDVCRGWAVAGGLVLYATPQEGYGPVAGVTLRLAGGRLETRT